MIGDIKLRVKSIICFIFSAVYIYIYIYKVKLATVVEKAPFSVATTTRCRGGRNSFPRIAPLYP